VASASAAHGSPADVPGSLRTAMRYLASGVGVVSALGPAGPAGLAATSITSLALDPPSLLVCVNRSASLHAHLSVGSRFCVSLLAADQKDVAATFGGGDKALRFQVGDWVADAHVVLRLAGALANISCVVDQMILYGTHSIVIGGVDEVHLSAQGAPLIYYDGAYQ